METAAVVVVLVSAEAAAAAATAAAQVEGKAAMPLGNICCPMYICQPER